MGVETELLPALWSPFALVLVAVGAILSFLVGLWSLVRVALSAIIRMTGWLGTRTDQAATVIRAPVAAAQGGLAAAQEATRDQPAEETQHPGEQALSPERRRFLTAISLAIGGLGAAIISVPVIGVLFYPLWRERPAVWRDVGRVEDFAIGETVQVAIRDPDPQPWAGFAAETPAWLRRMSDDQFVVFSAYCTHVGCPVSWEADAELFLCPCHGGVFYQNGSVAAGPPSRPLDLFEVRVENGIVQVSSPQQPLPVTGNHHRPSRSRRA
jgi:menaquinol-cytochrome c reductase iron-sulfur subunit